MSAKKPPAPKRDYDFSIKSLGEAKIPSPLGLSSTFGDGLVNYIMDGEYVRYSVLPATAEEIDSHLGLLERAGPREKIYFHPSHTHAAIVSCGGLCPGMNDVIRAIVRCLWNRYGVRRITGIQYGFKGMLPEFDIPILELNPKVVDDIHKIGGTVLGSSRGYGERVHDMVDCLERLNINMLFTIGGDGTQRGTLDIAREIERRKLKIATIGIPKTIDNDFSIIQRSFGFETAVAEATKAVSAAHVEAKSYRNGVGLVKLMGRESGFIAAFTAIASHETNFCLIPEVDFDLEGPNGLFAHLEKRLVKSAHAVIVVAEGAGQKFFMDEGKKDASGNKKLGDIGVFLKEKIAAYFASKNFEVNLKYIDPSYIIRSAVASPTDSMYCEQLGNYAAHAAMAGKCECLVGLVNNKFVHLPTSVATMARAKIDPEHSLWRDTLDSTQQPERMVNS
jgi:6-phosphofructokinase 1